MVARSRVMGFVNVSPGSMGVRSGGPFGSGCDTPTAYRRLVGGATAAFLTAGGISVVDSAPMALIHTCYRITDIDRSVAFYNALGFEEIGRIPIGDEAVNVFMNQPGDGDMPRLELTYNYGVDQYDLGSGYGHIAITSDDLDGTLSRLAEQGIEPEK